MRIALLTPYSGANLGDGAIHDAIVANMQRYDESIEFVSLVTEPQTICALHGTSAVTPSGSIGPFELTRPQDAATDRPRPLPRRPAPRQKPVGPATDTNLLGRIKSAIKRAPIAGRLLVAGARRLSWLWSKRSEPSHLCRSFALARNLDLILACGGGQLNDAYGNAWGHPYALFRWAAIARLTGTPFAIASVGVGSLSLPLSRYFIRRALSWSDYRSFRDPASRDRLSDSLSNWPSNWPVTRDDPIVPDFAYSLPGRRKPVADRRNGAYRIAISPIKYGAHRRGVPGQEAVYRNYLDALAKLALTILDSEHELVFVTSSWDDIGALELLLRQISQVRPEIDPNSLVKLPSDDVRALVSSLSTIDVMIASRLHSVILAQRNACPTLAVSFEAKVEAHMRIFGQERFLIDGSEIDETVLTRRFREMLDDFVPLHRDIGEKAEAFSERVQRQYPLLLDLARNGA